MPAWFDITTLERLNGVDRQGIDESVEQVTALIEREQQRGVELQNIVIAGFSQGGVIALHTSLSLPNSLAGIIALSTYLPFAEEISVTKCETPVFMAHGLFDPVISVMLGKHSYDKILPHYVNAEWHEYPMEHSICAQEIDAISQWLHKLPDFVGEYA
jgi:phospholipase/carboxylesterase